MVASLVTLFHGIVLLPCSMSMPLARSNFFGRQLSSVLFQAGPFGVLFFFLCLLSFLSGNPFLLALRLDLFCSGPGVYGKGFSVVFCFSVVF